MEKIMPKTLTAEELADKEKRLKQRADALARKHAYAAKKAAEITARFLGGCGSGGLPGRLLPPR